MKKSLYIAALVLLLQGCASTVHLPQNTVMPNETKKTLTLTDLWPAQQQQMLSTIMEFLPKSSGPVIIVAGPAIPATQLATVKDRLMAFGYTPDRIQVQLGVENTLELVFSIQQWRQDIAPANPHEQEWYSSKAVHSEFGKATAHNVAVQHVRIQDLSSPASLSAPNPLAAVGAVERYQKGQVRELGEISLDAGESGGM